MMITSLFTFSIIFGPTNKTITNGGRPTITELAARMDQLEQLVHSKLQTLPSNWSERQRSESEVDSRPVPREDMASEEICSIATPRHQGLAPVQPVAFSGETSIRYTLNQLEGNLARLGENYEPSIAGTPARISTPAQTLAPSPGGWIASCAALDIHKILHRYGVEASKPRWDRYLHTFCDAVHTMYPFLHLPSLWRQYTEMWQTCFLESPNPETLGNRDEQVKVAQALICLAIGRCTASPREVGAGARHSAGWSLYRAAADLFGDILSILEDCVDQVLILQTLALMV